MTKGRKTGGRQKGTPNKLTYQTRMRLLEMFNSEIDQMPDLLESIEPIDRIELLIKILPYLIPKLQPSSALEADQEGLKPSTELIRYIEEKNKKESARDKLMLDLMI